MKRLPPQHPERLPRPARSATRYIPAAQWNSYHRLAASGRDAPSHLSRIAAHEQPWR